MQPRTRVIYSAVPDKISPMQFGRLQGSFAIKALIYPLHELHKAMHTQGNVVRIVFRKAFDLTDHKKKRLESFSNIGVRPGLYS